MPQRMSSNVAQNLLGMFLYARVVLENLLGQITLRDLRQELQPDTFPKGIDQASVTYISPNSMEPFNVNYQIRESRRTNAGGSARRCVSSRIKDTWLGDVCCQTTTLAGDSINLLH